MRHDTSAAVQAGRIRIHRCGKLALACAARRVQYHDTILNSGELVYGCWAMSMLNYHPRGSGKCMQARYTCLSGECIQARYTCLSGKCMQARYTCLSPLPVVHQWGYCKLSLSVLWCKNRASTAIWQLATVCQCAVAHRHCVLTVKSTVHFKEQGSWAVACEAFSFSDLSVEVHSPSVALACSSHTGCGMRPVITTWR
jgi:hypothetical protein